MNERATAILSVRPYRLPQHWYGNSPFQLKTQKGALALSVAALAIALAACLWLLAMPRGQMRALPDGSQITLEGITYSSQHEFDPRAWWEQWLDWLPVARRNGGSALRGPLPQGMGVDVKGNVRAQALRSDAGAPNGRLYGEAMSKQQAAPPSVDQLVMETQQAFEFLIGKGYGPPAVELVLPDCGRGDFVISYRAAESVLRIRYLDMEVDVERDGLQLFGASRPGRFTGNMFSRQNLLRCMTRIAVDVAAAMEPPSSP